MQRCRPAILITAVAACALLLLAAGCGSSSPSSASSITASSAAEPTQAQVQQELVSFSGCMRSHGVSDFPDPSTTGFKAELAPSTPHSPAFVSAYAGCRHLLPGGGPHPDAPRSQAQIAAFLAFARCLRNHGFPSFPDPTPTGDLSREMLARAGIDIHQPAVVQAADACVSVTHGVITKADVARFVAGQ